MIDEGDGVNELEGMEVTEEDAEKKAQVIKEEEIEEAKQTEETTMMKGEKLRKQRWTRWRWR